MANRWGKKWKQWQTLFTWAPKSLWAVTAAIEMKRCLLFGNKVMTNIGMVVKSRVITLLTKVCLVKAMVFPVVMYECESWTIKKVEHQRTDAFKLWFLEKTLESPLDCKEIKLVSPKGNQPWIHWKDWYWSWRYNTSATCFEEPTHWKRPRCWERLKAGGEGDDRGWDGWMAPPTQWTWVWANYRRSWRTRKPGVGSQSQTQLRD